MGMTIVLRLALFGGALFTLVYFLRQIQKSRLQIDYAIFWSLFAGALVVLGIFPEAVIWTSLKLGFESPANMVFLLIIFVLVVKLFTNTLKLSKMNRQITDMAQHIALVEMESKQQQAQAPGVTGQEKDEP